jgi:hypothetical protein
MQIKLINNNNNNNNNKIAFTFRPFLATYFIFEKEAKNSQKVRL